MGELRSEWQKFKKANAAFLDERDENSDLGPALDKLEKQSVKMAKVLRPLRLHLNAYAKAMAEARVALNAYEKVADAAAKHANNPAVIANYRVFRASVRVSAATTEHNMARLTKVIQKRLKSKV
jgi:hypothetical protein